MRWWILAVLFLARTCMALEFQVLGAVAPLASPALGLDHAAMGQLLGLYWLPGIFLALPAGLLGQRFGLKRLGLASLALMALGGLLLSASWNYPTAAAARLVEGAGNAILSVMISAMVAAWFRERELSTAMAIVFDSWQFGLAAALVTFPPIAEWSSWQGAILAATLFCLMAGLLVAAVYRTPATGDAPPTARLPDRAKLLGRAGMIPTLAALVWTTYNVGQIIFLTYAPPLLAGRGLPLAEGARIVSLSVWVAMVTMPLGGVLTDRSRNPLHLVVFGAAGSGLAGILFALGFAPTLTCLAMGVFIGLPAGGILALPTSAVAREDVTWSLGWFMAVYYVLVTLSQFLAGYIREFTSDQTAVLFGAGLILATVPCLIPIRLLQRRPLPA
ncbi:MAG: arabinose transporter permease [Rhodospirillales bacterium]|jgi:predicted MFS family arabinose efflux permease|nr:arabinose transporter permease [Rhodospirillales bacterium]